MIRARAHDVGVALILPVILVTVWWFASAHSASVYYPPLATILKSFREEWLFSHVSSDVLPSLKRMFVGYALAIVLGIAAGVALGRSRTLSTMFHPAVTFARSIPATALVPIAIVLLGIGDTAKVWLIAFACVFPVLLNTIDGVRSIDPGLEDVARSFRLTTRQRVLDIQVPSAAPAIFAGMRIALAFAFIMMVVSEFVGAINGIGHVTFLAEERFDLPQVWSGMMLLAILGATFNVIFGLVEARILRWHYRSKGH